MPKDRDPTLLATRRIARRSALERTAESRSDASLHALIETRRPALEEPSVEGRGRAQGEAWLEQAGRDDPARERVEQGLGEIGRQRQDGGIGIGFSTTFGSGKGGKQTFGVIGDPGGDLGLGGVGAGVVHGEKGYDFGLGTGKVGGPIKITTLDDIIGAVGGSKSGGSKSGGSQSGGSTAGSTPAPSQPNENRPSEGRDGEKKADDGAKQDESNASEEPVDTNTSEGDYPEPTGDPTVIPPPEGQSDNGQYSDGSDGTPSGSLERKEWLNPQGPAAGGVKPRINRKRRVLGPIHVGPSDGDGRGTGGAVIGTGNGRPDVPVIGGDGGGFKPSPCPEDVLLNRSRRLLKRNKPV